MHEQPQYAAASHIPFIKSPSLRIPRPAEAPPDIHPLPDDINAYFAYPFTLEPHILTLESSRRATLASHAARHATVLKQREEEKERRRREALRKVAPGFEPQSAPLVPVRVQKSITAVGSVSDEKDSNNRLETTGEAGVDNDTPGHTRQRNVMDDLVDHLAALDAAQSGEDSTRDLNKV